MLAQASFLTRLLEQTSYLQPVNARNGAGNSRGGMA
jgi:hypothetical protein